MGYSTISEVEAITGAEYTDTAYLIESVTGTFVAGEDITGGTSAQTSTVTVVGQGYLEATPGNTIKEISEESITGSTSSATATVTRIKSPTKPTRAQVTAFIADVYGEINHMLGLQGFDVPVTEDANRLKWLMERERIGVAAKIEALQYVQNADNESDRGTYWQRQWNKCKKNHHFPCLCI